MYDRIYQSKPCSTIQTQNTDQVERKGMYLPSQSFDPFRTNDNSSQSNVVPAQMMEDE